MSDQAMPDGKRRGGFARLAAIVKAERAKGGHVIFAHAGDTLSPSLMSGLDRGAHIITLTNLIPPDIFVPGNHEFDFGKAIFLQRMAEAKFPLYAANLRGADGAPLPNFKDRSIVTFDGVRIGLTGATYDDAARSSSPEDLKFAPTVATIKEQADIAAARRRRFRGRGRACRPPAGLRASMATGAIDLLLTGHDHDLFINYDGRDAAVESSYDAHYVTAVDVTIDVKVQNGQARCDLVAAVPRHRHRNRDARPRGRGRRLRGFEQALQQGDGRAARHHRGRARQPQRHRAHARGRDRQSHRRRDARGGATPTWRS